MCKTFNNMIDLTSFPAVLYLQLAHIIPVSKKGYENSIEIIDLLMSWQIF